RTTTDGSGLHRDDRGAVGRDWGGADVGAWDPPGVAARVQLRRLPQGDDLQPVASFRDDVDRLTEEELAEYPSHQVGAGGCVEVGGPPAWIRSRRDDGSVEVSHRVRLGPQRRRGDLDRPRTGS